MNRIVRLVGLCLLLNLGCAAAVPVDLLLVAADDALLQPVVGKLQDVSHETHAAWEFWTGTLAGKSVAVARSGGDPLNAVAALTLAVRQHPPRLVVVYGVARPHDPALKAGDVVVSRDFVPFDGMYSSVTPLDGGSDALRWATLPHLALTPGEQEAPVTSIPAEAAALAVALHLTSSGRRVVAGTLGSANQVNREADRIVWLREQWHTSTEDFESAHVALAAHWLGVPTIGFRIVDGPPAEIATFTLRFVEAWK